MIVKDETSSRTEPGVLAPTAAEVATVLRRRLRSGRLRPTPRAVEAAVAEAAVAFVAADCDADVAAARVLPAMRSLGRRAAARGHGIARVTHDFGVVVRTCLTGADELTAIAAPQAPLADIRLQVRSFLTLLRGGVISGHAQMCVFRDLDQHQRGERVVRALLAAEPVSEEVLRLAGIDTAGQVPVAWVDVRPRVAQVRRLTVLMASDRSVALVPPGSVEGLRIDGHRIVIGPVRRTADAADALALARRAAGAVRSGAVRADGNLIRCEEIAPGLVLAADDLLAGLLVDHWLSGFLPLKPERRVSLGKVLLSWLETRESLAEVATRHHIARQTAHEQIKIAKKLVGDPIDDPSARAALIVALHAAVERWQRDG